MYDSVGQFSLMCTGMLRVTDIEPCYIIHTHCVTDCNFNFQFQFMLSPYCNTFYTVSALNQSRPLI